MRSVSTFSPTILNNQAVRFRGNSSSIERDQARTRVMAPAVTLFIVLCLQLGVRIAIIAQGYQLEAMRNQLLENDKSLRHYRLQYAVKTSPERLAGEARQRLGMIPSRPQQLRKLS